MKTLLVQHRLGEQISRISGPRSLSRIRGLKDVVVQRINGYEFLFKGKPFLYVNSNSFSIPRLDGFKSLKAIQKKINIILPEMGIQWPLVDNYQCILKENSMMIMVFCPRCHQHKPKVFKTLKEMIEWHQYKNHDTTCDNCVRGNIQAIRGQIGD